jgi:predicted NBD/HSP70 family sugar kinase
VNTTIIGRTCAAAVLTLVGLAGATAPASADEPAPSCDPVVLDAALTKAQADARAAQKAYTTHTKTSMQALVKQLKAREVAEARAAEREARRLAAAARKDADLRDEAKAARETARVEAKEAARALRASVATLKKQVKAERVVLKAQWDAAKEALQELRRTAEKCAEGDASVTPESPGSSQQG